MNGAGRVDVGAIPAELQNRRNWIRWKEVPKEDGKVAKVPVHPTRPSLAATDNPKTWGTFHEVMNRVGSHDTCGIGFVFTEKDGIVGFDFDNCLSEEGRPNARTAAILSRLGTYTEISPSGFGLHAIGFGRLNGHRGLNRKKELGIEVYGDGRYFTMTGNVLPGAPSTIADCQAALDELIAELTPKRPESPPAPVRKSAPDLFERARAYIRKMPEAISGHGGHEATFRVALALVKGFSLPEDEALDLLREYSARCVPPWSEKELVHKIDDAVKADVPDGYILDREPPRQDRGMKHDGYDGIRNLSGQQETKGAEPDGGVWIRLSDVRPERVSWLQPSRLALGKITLWDGDPGIGKGFALVSLFAAVTTGAELPGGGEFGPADVILLSSEDGLADTIRPRLDAVGADSSRVHVLSFVRRKGEKFFPSLRRDMDVIEKKTGETKAALLGIDPFMGFLGVKDAHKDADVKEALGPFAQMLDRLRLAAVGIRHLSKAQVAQSLYRGGGSIGIIGAARSGFLFAYDPDDDTRIIVAATKSNLCPKPPSLAFRIGSAPNGTGRAFWEPRTNEHQADALLRAAIDTQGGRRAGTEAAEWLEGALRGGPVPSADLKDECEAKGIAAFKTVREVAKKMGVVMEKETGKKGRGAWIWRLPGDQLSHSPAKGKVPSSKLHPEQYHTHLSPSSPSSMFPLLSLSSVSRGNDEEEGT